MSHDERLREITKARLLTNRINVMLSLILLLGGWMMWWFGEFSLIQVLLGILLLIPPLLMVHMWRRTRMLLRFNEAMEYQRIVWSEFILALVVVCILIGIATSIILTESFSLSTVPLLVMFVTALMSRHVDQRMKQIDPEHVTYANLARYQTKRS